MMKELLEINDLKKYVKDHFEKSPNEENGELEKLFQSKVGENYVQIVVFYPPKRVYVREINNILANGTLNCSGNFHYNYETFIENLNFIEKQPFK